MMIRVGGQKRQNNRKKMNQTDLQIVNEIVPGLTKEHLDLALRMIESGVDEKDIPYILNAGDRHSIVSWQNQDPKIRHLFNQAREIVLNKVENSLLRAALGGTLTTVKSVKGKNGETTEEVTTKEVGPNIVAIEKILRLFRPDPWANLSSNKEIEEGLTPEELSITEEVKMKKLGGKFFEELKSRVVKCKVTV